MHSDTQRKDRLQATKERARVSPVRAWILDRFEKDRDRSMNPKPLVEELTCEGWDASLPQVNYHLRWLSDADLVPAPCHGG
jgi:Fe2+ or Zn2+ uptake regulation protein